MLLSWLVRLDGFNLLLVCKFQGGCSSEELWWSMCADEAVVQLLGSVLFVLHPMAGLRLLLCSSQLFRTVSHSHMQGKMAVCNFGIWTSYICFSVQVAWVSGIKIFIYFCLHRFMLMEIVRCRHMKGGQALGNSMVISSLYGHFVTSTSICFGLEFS
jgi:hypothetical protein